MDQQYIADALPLIDDDQLEAIEAHLRAAGLLPGSLPSLLAAAIAAGAEVPGAYAFERSDWWFAGIKFDQSPLALRDFAARHLPSVIDTSRTQAWPFQVSDWQPGLDAATT